MSGISPKAFARQLDWLAAAGYSPGVTSKSDSVDTLILTFDDAFEDQIRWGLSELSTRGAHATAFVITDFVGQPAGWDYQGRSRRHADWSLLATWIGEGHTVGSHSCTHRDLRTLTTVELTRELTDSRRRLEDRLAVPVHALSYPFGRYDGRVALAVAAAGYTQAYTTRPPGKPFDSLCIPRIVVGRLDTPRAIHSRIQGTGWGRVECVRQNIVSFWSGGTALLQRLRPQLPIHSSSRP